MISDLAQTVTVNFFLQSKILRSLANLVWFSPLKQEPINNPENLLPIRRREHM